MGGPQEIVKWDVGQGVDAERKDQEGDVQGVRTGLCKLQRVCSHRQYFLLKFIFCISL